jgi:ubiquinone/menaquinone biosynthesis C-methylase UbiE
VAEFKFDEELSRKIEAIYLTPDVVAQRGQVLQALNLSAGERVLDIGSGPGLLAFDMATAVGREGRVCGIDASESMVAIAGKRCAAEPWIEFRIADATKLPYPDDSFDAAVATQVYEFIPNIPAALAELYRILRPGGRALVLDTDYGSLVINTRDEPRMARILSAWDEHFVHATLPRTLSRQLRQAGFTIRHRAAIPMETVASFAVGRNKISQNEADAWFAEFATLGAEGEFFFSLNRYLFLADKPNRA